MSWLGLRHKGVEVLYPSEWNKVVDGLDILYAYLQRTLKLEDLPHLPSDVAPDKDNLRNLGEADRAWKNVYAYYGYFNSDVYVQGKRVIKDEDPIKISEFIDKAKTDVDYMKDRLATIANTIKVVATDPSTGTRTFVRGFWYRRKFERDANGNITSIIIYLLLDDLATEKIVAERFSYLNGEIDEINWELIK